MRHVTAIVLTYNRQRRLDECLRAILAQSEPPQELIVLDNGSTDGTASYLRDSGLLDDSRIAAYHLERNIGPAAGFDLLVRLAYAGAADWLWCLEDDIVPERDALKELKAAFARNFSRPEELGFLQSVAVSADGSPSNVPDVDLRAAPHQCPSWADRLDAGLVKLRWATLNSTLIPRTTLDRVGALAPDFYYAGEDIDLTLRVTEILPGYLVGRSRVVHTREAAGIFSVLTQTEPERIRLGRFYYRNNLYLRRRYYSRGRTLLYVGKCMGEALKALGTGRHGTLRAASILRGLALGLAFAPSRRSLDAPLPARPERLGPSARQPSVAAPAGGPDCRE